MPIQDNSEKGSILNIIKRYLHKIKCSVETLVTNTDPTTMPGASCENPSFVQLCTAPVDFEYKSIGDPICYECPDGTKYQVVLCKKYEDGVETETTTIVVGPNSEVLEELPDCAVPCTTECKEVGSQGVILDWDLIKT